MAPPPPEDRFSDAAPAPVAGPQPASQSPEALLQVAWRQRWVVLLVSLASLAAAFIYLGQATPLYTSDSRLYVEQAGPMIMNDGLTGANVSSNYLYTQAELLRSTPILSAALEDDDLDRLRTLANVDNPVGYLKGALDVRVGGQDELITVVLESPYPEEAARLVNSIVDAYVTYQSRQKQSTAAEVIDILRREKVRRDEELEQKFERMLEFRREHGALSFELDDGGSNVVVQRLARLSEALTTAQLDTIEAKAAYESAAELAEDPARLRRTIESGQTRGSLSGAEGELRAELSRLQQREADMLREFTEEHPSVQSLRQKTERIREQLAEMEKDLGRAYVASTEQQWEQARQREQEISTHFEEQQAEALELNELSAEYAMMQADVERAERLSEILDDRIKEINVSEDAGALNIRILEVAKPADNPSRPQRARIMAMALVLGLMGGGGLGLLRDWLDGRLRSPEEAAAAAGNPLLGVVPHMSRREEPSAGRKVLTDSLSPIAEAYRTIRTAVYFGAPGARTLLVTSPAPADGKSTVTSNLGIAMAQAGQRVLILDADFRRPIQHEIFQLAEGTGLSTVLAKREDVDVAIQSTDVEGLDVLPCGPIPPNPSEMLNSAAFREALAQLSDRYDQVLVDSPPLLPVTDSRILAATCQATILVLRADKSTRKVTGHAIDGLLSVHARVLGVVVNDTRRGRFSAGYYQGYGYYGTRYGENGAAGADGSRPAEKQEVNA